MHKKLTYLHIDVVNNSESASKKFETKILRNIKDDIYKDPEVSRRIYYKYLSFISITGKRTLN